MSNIDLLFKRRSIRKYTDEPVSASDTEQILRAAMAAPSASNKQPWQFITIRDRAMLTTFAELHPYAKMLNEATLCIAVCGEKANKYAVQDCSAATQNILLAAAGLGLGSVWLGVHPNPEREPQLAGLLKMPDSHFPLCLIAIGHPAEQKPPADRYDPARVHDETW